MLDKTIGAAGRAAVGCRLPDEVFRLIPAGVRFGPDGPAVLQPPRQAGRGHRSEHAMSGKLDASITLARVLNNRNGSARGPAERVSFTAMGLGAGGLGAGGSAWHNLTAVRACMNQHAGEACFVPMRRLSMLDRNRCPQHSVGGPRCRVRTLPGIGTQVSNRETADQRHRGVTGSVRGSGRKLHRFGCQIAGLWSIGRRA